MQNASDWLRQQTAPALSTVFLLLHAVKHGGFDPHLLRRELDVALGKLRLDEPARSFGFTTEHLRHVQLALVAAADEFTQNPGSRCNYSAPPPAGELPLLQQKYFNNRTDLGHFFFESLKTLLDKHSPSPVEHAVLEVFALCINLGFHGKYEAFDLDGYEAIKTRLFAKLRSTLALPEGPPLAAPAPWPAVPRPGRLMLWAAGATLLFATALFFTYRAEVTRSAVHLQDNLKSALQQARP